ncbi:hypothetical protein BN000_00607 [Mycobacterium europaeum]|uniref:Lipoprotein n=1 Tax=Mycobacterium europaeum TaxID=761804 RepID=A0A0U1CX04_9MYCO|nr:hypothetical protein [Mycobacterium europaeum]CQD03632.1 hypothetical protein BN000_00607 [Mycobacterium europaeum]
MSAPIKAVAAAALSAIAVAGCSTMNHQMHTGCRVTGKDQLYSASGDKNGTRTTRTKRVSTTCGAFDVEDSIGGGFNSYDNWSLLEVGKTYDIETGGYRVGIFGSFPVVTKVLPK